MVLAVETVSHVIVVSIKPPLVVCFYCFPVSIEFIVNILSLGNALEGQSTAEGCIIYLYMLLTKSEVEGAGYWPSSLFALLWTETKLAWSIKDLLYGIQVFI